MRSLKFLFISFILRLSIYYLAIIALIIKASANLYQLKSQYKVQLLSYHFRASSHSAILQSGASTSILIRFDHLIANQKAYLYRAPS